MPTPQSGFPLLCALRATVVVLVLFLVLTTGAETNSQETTTALTGAVTAGGAVVPNASVTVTNKATGQTRTTTTNSSGQFTFSGLLPGQYSVKVSVQGFAEAFREASIQPGSASSLNIDLDVLPVGGTLFAEIKGTVRDDKGDPIEDASLEFVPDDGGASVTETSAKDGTYSRSGLRAGTYDVIAKATGYVQAKKRVKVEPHQQKTQNFKLRPASKP